MLKRFITMKTITAIRPPFAWYAETELGTLPIIWSNHRTGILHFMPPHEIPSTKRGKANQHQALLKTSRYVIVQNTNGTGDAKYDGIWEVADFTTIPDGSSWALRYVHKIAHVRVTAKGI